MVRWKAAHAAASAPAGLVCATCQSQPALHPHVTPFSRPQRLLPEQRLLDDEQQCQNVLAYLPNDASEHASGCAFLAACLRAVLLLAGA